MNKYLLSIALIVTVLVTTAAFTKAQNVPTGTLPTQNKFTDIAEVNFSDYINSDESAFIMGLRNVFSFKCSKNLAIGPAIGFAPIDNTINLPLSADLRWYFYQKNKAATPYLNLNGGYSICFANNNADYFFSTLNFGVNIAVTNKVSLELALGVEEVRYASSFLNDLTKYSSRYLVIPFTVGLSF